MDSLLAWRQISGESAPTRWPLSNQSPLSQGPSVPRMSNEPSPAMEPRQGAPILVTWAKRPLKRKSCVRTHWLCYTCVGLSAHSGLGLSGPPEYTPSKQVTPDIPREPQCGHSSSHLCEHKARSPLRSCVCTHVCVCVRACVCTLTPYHTLSTLAQLAAAGRHGTTGPHLSRRLIAGWVGARRWCTVHGTAFVRVTQKSAHQSRWLQGFLFL